MVQITGILCPIDFSEFSRRAIEHAVAMARWYEARLTVLYVHVNVPAVDVEPIVLGEGDREQLMTEMRRFVEHVPSEIPLNLLIREASDIRREILTQADAIGADLLVIGSHGRSGFERLLLGSVTEKVIRKATCPVMVVPRGAPDIEGQVPVGVGRSRILCPVDFSDGSLRALEYAIDIAEEADARLTLLHAIEMPPELREHPMSADFNVDEVRRAAEAASLRHLRELIPESVRTYCAVETVVREGAAYRQILRLAAEEKTDLIVMGVRGRGAVDLMVFGSNTAHVIRTATCPVLTVRQP